MTLPAVRFNVSLVENIIWNPDAFDHLDIPEERKEIVRTLTESHSRNAGAFDDFIEGKGIGLIFNLHGKLTLHRVDTFLSLSKSGPPGVGKTLTAEATSEGQLFVEIACALMLIYASVTRSPLYIVSAGDLGTTAGELDDALNGIFSLASTWKAIVLIDEADVFLEQRDLHDLQRNAMVAVFLRQLEYIYYIPDMP